MISYVTAACIMAAANSYGIPPIVIASIMKTEGGRVGQYSENTNGTKDLGPMQINDGVWIKPVADEFLNGNQSEARRRLKDDGCFNVYAGTWILRTNIDSADGDVMEGVGRYHSWTTTHKEKYKKLFLKSFRYIRGE
jgi:soluble lytic murein transglycosylase-like protein